MSWKSPEEASEDLVLLGRGWIYGKEQFAPATKWMYATDFRPESLKKAKPDKGIMHMVRFRRLYRTKHFKPDEFVDRSISDKCSQVDSSATDALGRLLLDALTYCSLLHSPKAYTAKLTLPLKERIINLAIRQPQSENGRVNTDPFYQLDQLRIKLENFIELEKSQTVMSRLLASVDFPFEKRNGEENFEKRKTLVARHCFSTKECDAISALVIKKLDPTFQLHCDVPQCGEKCKFFRVQCPNQGCPMVMSRLYLDKHDHQCIYKIIECECKLKLPRHELQMHKTQSCVLREVNCPFKKIGCTKCVKACDLEKHLDEDTSVHLLLAMNRMMEHQDVINNLNTRVVELEGQNRGLRQALETRTQIEMTQVSALANEKAKE